MSDSWLRRRCPTREKEVERQRQRQTEENKIKEKHRHVPRTHLAKSAVVWASVKSSCSASTAWRKSSRSKPPRADRSRNAKQPFRWNCDVPLQMRRCMAKRKRHSRSAITDGSPPKKAYCSAPGGEVGDPRGLKARPPPPPMRVRRRPAETPPCCAPGDRETTELLHI